MPTRGEGYLRVMEVLMEVEMWFIYRKPSSSAIVRRYTSQWACVIVLYKEFSYEQLYHR